MLLSRRIFTHARFGLRSLSSSQQVVIGHGISPQASTDIYRNLSYEDIHKHEVLAGEKVTSSGAVAIDTGIFTGRSPKDKWIVKREPSSEHIWWGNVNRSIESPVFDKLHEKVKKHYNLTSEKVYVFDGYVGTSPKTRRKIRIVSEIAWQHHFVTNMFIRPTADELAAFGDDGFEPDFTIVNACRVSNDEWEQDKLNSEVFVAFDVEQKLALIGGTFYGGEMKKGIFSMMNYWLPLEGHMTMHCSANVGTEKKDTALYFGLSGTGKTTLSADASRELIGDDEHGWDEDGVFNFEGGCYAKTINLSRKNEPEIFDAIRRDALLENVHTGEDGVVDYSNVSKTENGRVSYPIFHIDNIQPDSVGGHPNNIFFLTADAFGVLPPISRLTPEQAMYHFLAGYTAKVAGTERGVTEPTATFSACFGAAFMTHHPAKYASLLGEKLKEHGTKVYLVNTGWVGGAAGEVDRLSLKTTRRCIDAVLNDELDNAEFVKDPYFGIEVPIALAGIPDGVLCPADAWTDKAKYAEKAAKLVDMFKDNFTKYSNPGAGLPDYTKYGPM